MRRPLAAACLAVLALAGAASPVSALEDTKTREDNLAVAVNTEDGASLLRLAFSIRKVANGVVDETNQAFALASCADCQTVAIAFQIVLVSGDADVVVPENRAVAYNDECVECLTYASATQLVIGVDGPTRLTREGRARMAELYESLAALEADLASLSPAQLDALVQAAKQELVAILDEELVTVGRPDELPPEGTTTTTTAATSSTTSTTVRTTTSTTTSSSSTTSSTTTTTAPASTTTTEAG